MNVEDLHLQHQRQIDEMFKQHNAAMSQIQEQFDAKVNDAHLRYNELLKKALNPEVEPPSAPKESGKQAPAACWMEVNGEHMLVLNQEAAVMQLALLDQLAEVLKEMAKLAPKRGR